MKKLAITTAMLAISTFAVHAEDQVRMQIEAQPGVRAGMPQMAVTGARGVPTAVAGMEMMMPTMTTGDAATDAQLKALTTEMQAKIQAITTEYQAKMKAVIGNKKINVTMPAMGTGAAVRAQVEGNGGKKGEMRMEVTSAAQGDEAMPIPPQEANAKIKNFFRGLFGK